MIQLDNKRYYITLIIASILVLLLLIVVWSFSDNSEIQFGCSINNIQYIDVSPDECWNEDISNRFCPFLGDISCNGESKGISKLLGSIVLKNM